MEPEQALETVQVGWWHAHCCEEDLVQIETQEDLDDLLEELRDPAGFHPEGVWPTREAALRYFQEQYGTAH